jgi:hypothetical protein
MAGLHAQQLMAQPGWQAGVAHHVDDQQVH